MDKDEKMVSSQTILIVDDDDNLRNILSIGIQTAGYRVVTARNGQEGIERFDQHRPNLIILDVRMPVMNGYDFFKNMSERLEKTSCPIIGLTGEAIVENLFDGFDIDLYVTKPFDIEKLIKKIQLMLAQKDG